MIRIIFHQAEEMVNSDMINTSIKKKYASHIGATNVTTKERKSKHPLTEKIWMVYFIWRNSKHPCQRLLSHGIPP